MSASALQQSDAVLAPLVYVIPSADKPVTYNYPPPPGVPRQSGRTELRQVPIHDGRPLASRLALDVEGLAFFSHPTAVADFYDEAEVRAVYYPEMIRLLAAMTGAEKVVIFDHTIRHGASRPGLREPVRIAHNDYTPRSGPQRLRDLLPPAEAERRLRHRFALINVWRPIRGPVQATPLALCDARTIAEADLIATDLKYPDRTGEIFGLAYNPRHRWLYFPRMARDEVVLIKCFDSHAQGRARLAAHTAFDDPATPPEAPPRESIEIRGLVLYPPGVS